MSTLVTNNATSLLVGAITNVATTIVVTGGKGALYPNPTTPDVFYATLVDGSNNIEIVKVTARATDTMTVARGQDGTAARAYSNGDKFELRPVAALFNNKLDKDTGGTVSGRLVTFASATTGAGVNIPHGAAPTSPVNGDLWSTTAGFLGRVNGATIAFSYSSLSETLTNKTLTSPVFSTIVNTGTLTLPTTTDTLVGRATTDTLTNKTLTSPVLNSIAASSSVSDTGTISTSSPGFRGLPPLAKSSAYTLGLTDAGKLITITTGGIIVPANGSVAFPQGTAVSVFNNSSSSQTISITTDTLRQGGTVNTGSRTLGGYGLCTLVKTNTTEWVVSGSGIS